MLQASAIVLLGLVVAIWTREVPTADEMLALFQDGQRLYAVGAYDQAQRDLAKAIQLGGPDTRSEAIALLIALRSWR